MQGLSCCQGKGVQISYNHFLRLPAKYNYLASASYCILPAALRSVCVKATTYHNKDACKIICVYAM